MEEQGIDTSNMCMEKSPAGDYLCFLPREHDGPHGWSKKPSERINELARQLNIAGGFKVERPLNREELIAVQIQAIMDYLDETAD